MYKRQIVAHGIASRVGGERVVIGSHHFVVEDEKCTIPTAEQQKFDALKPEDVYKRQGLE